MTVVASIGERYLELVVLDNGPGFSPTASAAAFREQHSTKAPHRGRGLLEVQDAVERLGGSVWLFEYRCSELRIQLRLPLVES